MKLRTRLALIVLVTALPVVAAITWTRADFEHRTIEQGLRDFVLTRMENGGREMCEATPETFPEPPGGPRRPLAQWERDERRFEQMERAMTGERRPPPDDGPPTRPADAPPRPQRAPFNAPPRGLPGGGPARIELWAYDPSFKSANTRAPAMPSELRGALEGGAEFAVIAWPNEGHEGVQVALRMPWTEGPCAIMLARRPDRGPESAVSDLLWSSLALCVVLLGALFFAAGPIVERVRRLTVQVRESAAGRYATAVDERGRDEIAELARSFNTAGSEVKTSLDTLEKRERALRTFVENTTHDVMLPLTVLQGHLTTLRRRVEAGTLPDKDTVRDALEESHYLSSLLQNLAVAARLEGVERPIARHRVDVNALVERAVARQRPIATQKSISVDYSVPEAVVWVDGDVTLVEQMLSNVIHNAVRYGHEGGHVAVLLEERGTEPARFSLRVLDDGPGIPADLHGRVVERSFRTDEARTRHPDGLGLGLSIAKDVAERHGFDLEMRPRSAGGLEVEFSGPRASNGSAARAP